MQEDAANTTTGKTAGKETDDKKEESKSRASVSETWAEETIADLDDYIESQGIYLRQ